ncbi:hypothetical protein [Hyphomicrobium sp. DY-1]|uniref:hypothetical protein n=1 Tax=Hyphomicrobium sp. DY-1 TaxID=3075650 RepID=UPI0039C1990F
MISLTIKYITACALCWCYGELAAHAEARGWWSTRMSLALVPALCLAIVAIVYGSRIFTLMMVLSP